jgi:hypothetical protein
MAQDSESQASQTPVNQTNPAEGVPPLRPEQIWNALSSQQQRGVFQILVGVCQELLRRQTPGEAEVSDERC